MLDLPSRARPTPLRSRDVFRTFTRSVAIITRPSIVQADPPLPLFNQRQFATFAAFANCSQSTEAQSLACLRSAPTDAVRKASLQLLYNSPAEPGLLTYAPCSEGARGYVQESLARTLAPGRKVAARYTIAGNNWNDGDGYVRSLKWLPATDAQALAANEALARANILALLPISNATLDRALALYPLDDFADGGWAAIAGAVRQDVIFAWCAAALRATRSPRFD